MKTCVVTGASSGLGEATAVGLARAGAMVVMACRDMSRGELVATEVRAAARSSNVYPMQLDLACLGSIEHFSADLARRFGQLDVLVNNAGVIARRRQVTRNGFELQFGVNHLGHFALSAHLLPLLRRSSSARIVVVTSAVHQAGRIDWQDIQSERDYGMMKAYAQSKLANLLFVHEFAKRVPGVAINAVHPGAVATKIGRDMGIFGRLLISLTGKAPEKGAQGSLNLALAERLQGISGAYFKGTKRAKAGAGATNDDDARRLWQVSEKLTNLQEVAPEHLVPVNPVQSG